MTVSSICPKCGSANVNGPAYRMGSKGDYLRYVCGRCGYEQRGPTRDKDRQR